MARQPRRAGTGAVIALSEPGDAELLIKGGVADPVHNDRLAPILAKSMGAMVEGLTKNLDLAITKAVEQVGQRPNVQPQRRGGVHPAVRAAHGAQRSKRVGVPLTALRSVRGSDLSIWRARRPSSRRPWLNPVA